MAKADYSVDPKTSPNVIQVYPNLQEVEQASALQRRLYRAIRETMRAMAGRISGVANWEAKKMLARHIWLDAEHANAIRQRVLELRFPRVDVDLEVDKALSAVLEKLPSTESDAEFLAGVYRVIKPAILAAVESYVRQSDALDDAPQPSFDAAGRGRAAGRIGRVRSGLGADPSRRARGSYRLGTLGRCRARRSGWGVWHGQRQAAACPGRVLGSSALRDHPRSAEYVRARKKQFLIS